VQRGALSGAHGSSLRAVRRNRLEPFRPTAPAGPARRAVQAACARDSDRQGSRQAAGASEQTSSRH
jgi:hypothetical protein